MRNLLTVAAVLAGGIGLSASARGQASSASQPSSTPSYYAPQWGSAPSKALPPPRPIEQSDHDDVRLRPGVGYFGRLEAPLGHAADRSAGVHLIGVRFWFRRNVGLDAAIGLNANWGSGSESSSFAFAGRTSLPIALYISDHLTLFVAPTLAYAQGSENIPGQPGISPITGFPRTPPRTKLGGLRASVGARVGAEVNFGFIAATRLALSASVGIDATYSRVWTSGAPPPTSRDPDPAVTESTANRLSAATTPNDDPWASLLGNIALLCYF